MRLLILIFTLILVPFSLTANEFIEINCKKGEEQYTTMINAAGGEQKVFGATSQVSFPKGKIYVESSEGTILFDLTTGVMMYNGELNEGVKCTFGNLAVLEKEKKSSLSTSSDAKDEEVLKLIKSQEEQDKKIKNLENLVNELIKKFESDESNDSSPKNNASAKINSIEVPCSHEYVRRWQERDEENNPIYYDAIKISMFVDFEEVDKKFNISKERTNYLKIPAIAYLKASDGSETKMIDNVFYGYKDGKFVNTQTHFEKKIDPNKLAENPIIKCEVSG